MITVGSGPNVFKLPHFSQTGPLARKITVRYLAPSYFFRALINYCTDVPQVVCKSTVVCHTDGQSEHLSECIVRRDHSRPGHPLVSRHGKKANLKLHSALSNMKENEQAVGIAFSNEETESQLSVKPSSHGIGV